MEPSTEVLIRELARQINPKSAEGVKLGQGVVMSIQNNMTCTLKVDGGELETSGWRWLVNAYYPLVGDVVWLIDGGPGARFILGNTTAAASAVSSPLPRLATVHGAMARSPLNSTAWPDSIFSAPSLGPPYNISPGTTSAPLPEIRYNVPLARGRYKATAQVTRQNNTGHANFYATVKGVETFLGQVDTYAATQAGHLAVLGTTFDVYEPSIVTLTVRQMGTKNASSSGFAIVFQALYVADVDAAA